MDTFFDSSPHPEFSGMWNRLLSCLSSGFSHLLGRCGSCPLSKLPGKPVLLAQQDHGLRMTALSPHPSSLRQQGYGLSPLVVIAGLSFLPTHSARLSSNSTTDSASLSGTPSVSQRGSIWLLEPLSAMNLRLYWCAEDPSIWGLVPIFRQSGLCWSNWTEIEVIP